MPRYMLMNHFGGIYMDVDVECVTNMDSLIEPLPPGECMHAMCVCAWRRGASAVAAAVSSSSLL